MNAFVLTPGSVGIRFGAGAINQLPEVLVSLNKSKVLSSPTQVLLLQEY